MTTDSDTPESSPGRGWNEFAPLYDEHHERLFRVALLLCHGNRMAAEDATAEAFIKVYSVWAESTIKHFFAYARQTLLNEVLGQQRRSEVARRHIRSQGADGRGQRAPEDDIVDGAEAFALLGKVPPRQRAALVLRFYEDLSYEQIATALDVSLGTVKAQISTGLTKMRELMGAGETLGDDSSGGAL